MDTWKQFPSNIQQCILTAIRGDIRKKLTTKSNPAEDEPDTALDIGDITSYAQDLNHEIEENERMLSRKRRRLADVRSESEEEITADDVPNALHISSASLHSRGSTEVDSAVMPDDDSDNDQ